LPRVLSLRSVPPALLAALALAAPAHAAPAHAAGPYGDAGGFYSVLGVGQGQTVNAADLAAYELTGNPPPSFTNQLDMYSGVTRGADSLTVGTLDHYWKHSSFRTPDEDNAGGTEHPKAGVTIVRDARFRVPRIYGESRSDVMWGAGYATAEDRLFLMDAIRRIAEGRSAELLGSSAIADDSAQLGHQDTTDQELTDQFDRLPAVAGPDGAQGRQDYIDYVAGINTYIDEARTDPTKMPAEYPALGLTPPTWRIADTLQEALYLIAQFTANGGGELTTAQLMSDFQARFGRKWRPVYEDFRRAEDPESTTVTPRRFPSDRPGRPSSKAYALPDPGSLVPRDAVVGGAPSASSRAAARAKLPAWAQGLATLHASMPHHASNAMLVDAAHSADGRPVAAMGPQVSYYSPEVFTEYELHGGGIDVSGVSFPGASPYALIGHGKDFAWTGTTPNGDTVDTFAEKLCNADGSAPSFASTAYEHGGKCVPFEYRDQDVTTPTGAGNTEAPKTFTLRAMRSVHGPVTHFGKVGGQPVAFTESHVTSGREAQSLLAFMRLAENRPADGRSFQAAMRAYTGMENWFYVGRKDIAWLQSGVFPRHAKGTDLDLPIWGTGPYDWQGLLPPSANPREVDPKQGYLVSWNNKEAPGWRSPPQTWSFGPVQRARLLSRPLRIVLRHRKATLVDVARIAARAATADLRGTEVYSWIRRVLRTPAGDQSRAAVAALDAWTRAGSQRRDVDADNVDEHSAAIALIDEWWPRLVRGIFEPKLGGKLVDQVAQLVNPIPVRGTSTFFFDGWWNYVQKDLRRILRRHEAGRLSRAYCGGGSLRRCRAVLASTLADTVAAVAKAQGTDDMSKWVVHATCPKTKPPTCDQIVPKTGGAVDTPPFPFHNRGTFHQIDEIGGPSGG
jgi:acyl-homoserine lactone acylase PvdQ